MTWVPVAASDQRTPVEDLFNRFPNLFRAAVVTAVINAQSTWESTAVTFSPAFPTGVVPVVTATAVTTQPDQRLISIDSVTNTGFTLWGWNNINTTDIPVHYHAIAL